MTAELAPRGPATPAEVAPERRPGSVRRTTTIDMRWRDGWGSDLLLDGRARDMMTTRDRRPVVLHSDRFEVRVSPGRSMLAIDTEPRLPLAGLIGARCGGGFRKRLAEVLPDLDGTRPLGLLLDDIPGATLISGFAYSQWYPIEELLAQGLPSTTTRRGMAGICTGFMPGSSGLAPDGTSRWTHRIRAVDPLDAGGDVLGWHSLPRLSEVSMRRARRIDVWIDGETIEIDAMFQDSATRPAGGRVAVHEYMLTARADLTSLTLTDILPVPRVLPYAECPLAVAQVGDIGGVPLADLRAVVLERLQGIRGCTHLNDALRALADVPELVASLHEDG